MTRQRRPLVLMLVLLLLGLLAACGEDEQTPKEAALEKYGPVPEPAEAPEITEEPTGEVIEIGNGAEGIIVDEKTGLAAVGIEFPPSLKLIDARTLTTERVIELPGHPRHLRIAGPGGPVLVPSEDADELIEVPLPAGMPRATGVGDFPHDAVEAPNGRVFVADEMSNQVSVVEDGELIRQLDAPIQPGNIVYADGRIATVAVTERKIATYDPDTLEQTGELDAGVGPTHAGVVDDRVFVIDTQGDQIIEYDLAPELREVGTTDLPGTPYGVASDEKRDRLWVTLTEENTAVEFALTADGLREVERFPTVQQANTIAVDPRDGAALIVSRTDPALLERIEP
ncbi:YncE family protein [Thermoleophilia bacterium SCSIO 60948]|nr:YncE family protein [Thermoleophilia bacterium SCSIO 60948]